MKHFRRLLSALLVVTMCVSMVPMASSATSDGLDNFTKRNSFKSDLFTDVSKSNWFYDNVKVAYELGLMVGKGKKAFDPASGVTIAETITIAARIHSIYNTGKEDFAKSTPWYKVYVDYASVNGIITSATNDYTKPATRAQFATILANALPDKALEGVNQVAADAIPDVKLSDSCGAAVYKLYRAGIMVGNDENGTFAPNSDIKRSEVSAIVTRMADRALRKTVRLGEEYTVTFDMNGHGTQIPSQKVVKGYTAEKPNASKDSNYNFKGWYTNKTGGAQFDFNTPITSDVTLYAYWEVDPGWIQSIINSLQNRTHTVTFETNGGTPVASQKVKQGKTVTMPANPTKDGFDFAGWYVDAALTVEYDFATAVTKSMTLYAKWVEETTHTISFDSVGGTYVESQTVEKGGYATIPQNPEKEGYTFVGWYTDKTYVELFNFSVEVKKSYTLVARWVDTTDTTDTDGDGLTDPVEEYYGTDKTKPDTDGDRLSDYIEIAVLNLDPLKIDTDVNGTDDGDEDSDGDGITNIIEVINGTDPGSRDTDIDGLDDNEEAIHNTNPVKEDTDGDGVSDGKEVELGTDPLKAQSTFVMNVTSGDDEDGTKASVIVELNGEQVETLSVDAVQNDLFFPENMPGYMGKAYEFSVEGEFESATICFEFDRSELGPNSDPVIYYFNEEEQELEALETTVVGNVASAEVTHFSKYILIDRTIREDTFEWIDVWDNTTNYSGVEIILVIDDSGSMDWNDETNQRLVVAQNMVDKLPKNSKIGIVKFESKTTILTSELTDDKEIAKSYLTTSYFKSSGGTYMYRAIFDAFSLYKSDDASIMKVMVVLTDGETSGASSHSSAVKAANDEHVKIYTVGLGDSTSYFNSYLKPLATNTGAAFYLASDADELADIYNDISQEIDIKTDTDKDGIPDYYEDNMIIFSGVSLSLDKNNPDTDGDGLLDGEEVVIRKYYNVDRTQVIVTGKIARGNPLTTDTDGDGLLDCDDDKPLIWNVCDRDLAMCAALCYENGTVPALEKRFYLESEIKGKPDSGEPGENYYFYGYANSSEMSEYWKLIDYVNDASVIKIDNFSATTFKNGKNIIIAYRGTNELWEWADNVLCYGLGNYHSEEQQARAYAKKIVKENPGCKIYITGHSLGGYLAQIGTAELIESGRSNVIERTVYFNGIGMKFNKLVPIIKNYDMMSLYNFSHDGLKPNGKLISYAIKGDWVHMLGTHCGEKKEFYATDAAVEHHRTKYFEGFEELGFWESIGKIILDAGINTLGTGIASIVASPSVLYYYTYYQAPNFVDYTWITHETDSFFAHLKRK